MQQRMEVITLGNGFVNDWPIRDLIALDNQNLLEVIGNTRAVIRPAMLPPTTIACCPAPSNVTMLLPMLGACFAAMLVPMLLRNAPIYDSLREHTLAAKGCSGRKRTRAVDRG